MPLAISRSPTVNIYAGNVILLELPGGIVQWEVERITDSKPRSIIVREMRTGKAHSVPLLWVLTEMVKEKTLLKIIRRITP